MLLNELGSRQAEDENRSVSSFEDVPDEVEERLLGSVHVFQEEHERPLAGERLE